MPNSASAKKRNSSESCPPGAQSRRQERPQSRRSARSARRSPPATSELAESEFRLAAKRLDKAAADGIVHANLAARVKSRLSAALKAAKAKKK